MEVISFPLLHQETYFVDGDFLRDKISKSTTMAYIDPRAKNCQELLLLALTVCVCLFDCLLALSVEANFSTPTGQFLYHFKQNHGYKLDFRTPVQIWNGRCLEVSC